MQYINKFNIKNNNNAPSGEHKYNLRLTFRLPVREIVYFSKFLAFCYLFIHIHEANTVMNTSSAVFLK